MIKCYEKHLKHLIDVFLIHKHSNCAISCQSSAKFLLQLNRILKSNYKVVKCNINSDNRMSIKQFKKEESFNTPVAHS